MRERLRRDLNPAQENCKRLCVDLWIGMLAAGVYLAGKQIDLPEAPTTDLARHIAQVGGLTDFTLAFAAGAGRVGRQFYLSGVFQKAERDSTLPPTLQK